MTDIKKVHKTDNGNTLAIDAANGGKLKIDGNDVTAAMIAAGSNTGTIVAGTHAVTSGEETAGTLDIDTGLTSITAHFVQVLSGGAAATADAAISASGGTITVADGAATLDLAENDVVHWIAVGGV
ncbi:hypothetical protein [uncultured Mameliella sp.]|uniref:hypothetical protein n=1 Tax=uncultured Mameliella sp. TaxID=1447087 RepID=UPI0026379FD6|nr:hypothetical protein [uncultured Mameliella sp.]